MGHKVVKLLLGIRGVGATVSRNRAPDVGSLDTLGRENFGTIRIDCTDRVVTRGVNTIDEKVRDDVLGAIRGLGETGMTETVLLDEGGAVTQPTSDERGVKEGGGGISLVPDDDDGILQGAVPWTGEPFDSTSGPPVAEMGRLRELNTDWTWPVRRMLGKPIIICPLTHRRNILDDANELIEDSPSSDVALINRITATDGMESVTRRILIGLPLQLSRGRYRASCESEVGTTGLNDILIKFIEFPGSESGPGRGRVEGRAEIEYEIYRLVIFLSA